jgi:hypothetical protein
VLDATAVSCQALHDRRRECSGLAGARLGDAEYIASGKNDRDGFGLDWGRRFATFGLQRLKNRCAEAQVQKICQCVCFQEATLGRLRRKVDPPRNARDPLLGDTPRALGCRIGVWGAQQEDDSARVLVRPSRGWSAANRSIERSRLISCCDAQVKRDGNLKAMTTKLAAPTVDGRDAGGKDAPALYFGPLFRHDEDLNSAAEGAERTAD